ncbi:outer membrane beta-barrel protein [uncultured Desulfobulbus sp.]|uniref:outer membrane protein n=1 Tax=uncultured Desulfobulbus sp. TaxID=239745 RepID=UPI0029C76B5E|nr:outer membrane beta-barrel protein [uncultured Desulfobulbus sp.]
MKKVLSVMAVSAFVLTAGVALAGGPGKKMGPGCPEACQQQIDDLNSSQAQQNEQLGAHSKQLQNHEGRITDLEKAFADSWYARLGVRAAWMDQEDKWTGSDLDGTTGWGGAIAFGREFSMYQAMGKFRAEVEIAKQSVDLDDNQTIYTSPFTGGTDRIVDGSVDVTTIMVNGYYELPVADAFSLYAMVGAGYAKYDMDSTVAFFNAAGVEQVNTRGEYRNASDNVFAYKAGVGMTYNFTDQVAGDLGYEYLGVADTDLADSINGHNVVASVRFKF